MNTYTDNLKTITEEMPEVRYPLRKRIASELEQEVAERKIKRDVMLDAIPENHEHAEELQKLVDEEYKVAMLDISSGNGKPREAWDYDNGCFAEHITAQATEQIEHSKAGLAEELIDGANGFENKNETIYFDRELDGYLCVSDSRYSVWDTIALNGSLIVRTTAQWKKGFRKDDWKAYCKQRATKKHNALMGVNNGTSRARVSDEAMKRKEAKRLARLQKRMGAKVNNKIGFNAYQ